MFKNLNKLTNIEKLAKIWQIQLNVEYNNPHKNVRISFKDVGPFCEYMALDFASGYSGGGSGGMGFDLYNKEEQRAIEVKSCCTIQNAKCENCNAKFNNLFLDSCPDCGSKKFKNITDSRFGINAKETLNEYDNNIFGGFILTYISLKEHDIKNNILNVSVEWFRLDFDDDNDLKEIRLTYFKNQRDFGKKDTNNLLPYSFDFYKLAPLKIGEATIELNYADLDVQPKIQKKDVIYYPRVEGNKLTLINDEKELFKNLRTYDSKTNTADIKDFALNIPYRNKSLGKERGDTRKNKYNSLKKQSIK